MSITSQIESDLAHIASTSRCFDDDQEDTLACLALWRDKHPIATGRIMRERGYTAEQVDAASARLSRISAYRPSYARR